MKRQEKPLLRLVHQKLLALNPGKGRRFAAFNLKKRLTLLNLGIGYIDRLQQGKQPRAV